MMQPLGFVVQGSLVWFVSCLEQSPHACFGKFNHIVQSFGLKHNEANHFVFYCHTSLFKNVYLIMYVDDIVIIGNDATKISQ